MCYKLLDTTYNYVFGIGVNSIFLILHHFLWTHLENIIIFMSSFYIY